MCGRVYLVGYAGRKIRPHHLLPQRSAVTSLAAERAQPTHGGVPTGSGAGGCELGRGAQRFELAALGEL